MNIEDAIKDSVNQISKIIERRYPEIRAEQAKAVFDAEGAHNGRSRWLEYTESTKKRKGNKPIMQDTGELYDAISDPATFENSDPDFAGSWLSGIPNYEDKYRFADEVRPFHDIGEKQEDKEEIDKKLEEAINNELT